MFPCRSKRSFSRVLSRAVHVAILPYVGTAYAITPTIHHFFSRIPQRPWKTRRWKRLAVTFGPDECPARLGKNKKFQRRRCRPLRRIFGEGLRLGDATSFREARFTGSAVAPFRRVSSNFPHGTASHQPCTVAERQRGDERGERESACERGRQGEENRGAIVIKHRELAKLRCNLAGDVLPSGLARRGPRAASIHTHTHMQRYTRIHASVRRTEAVRHRKVLGDIAPAIRPSFWELNFCGSRLFLPLPPPVLTFSVRS